MKSNNDIQKNDELAQKEKALSKRILLLLDDNSWEEAKERCDKLLKLNPNNPEGSLFLLLSEHHFSSVADLLQKEPELVLTDSWKEIVDRFDEDDSLKVRALTLETEEKLKKAKAEESVAELRRIIQENEEKHGEEGAGVLNPVPGDSDGLGRRINTFKDRGEITSVVCLSLAFILLSISFVYYYLNVSMPYSYFEQANTLIKQNNHNDAKSILKKIKNYPKAVIKLDECNSIESQNLLKARNIQADYYYDNGDYCNAVALYKYLGFYEDANVKALESLRMANGVPSIIREAYIYDFKTILAKIEEKKANEKKAIEEMERQAAAREAEIERQKAEEDRRKLLEEQRRRMEIEESIRLKEEEARAKMREEEAIREGIQAEAERLEKEKEKRREAMKVTLGQNKIINIKGQDIELIACPAGSFLMGSPENEAGRNSDEIQHQVTISQGFYIGKYEVTQVLYKAVMGMNPARSFIKGRNKPVYQVSWFMANEFCDKLNILTRKSRPAHWHFDLPTEAQWEYACRAGYDTAFNNGGNLAPDDNDCPELDKAGWYSANTPPRQLSDVGKKQPNYWLIHDMHGGVWEWCKDYYGEYPAKPLLNPCQLEGYKKVLRGGSIRSLAKNCRSATRRGSVPGNDGNGEYDIGFRLVLVADSYERTFQADD